MKRFVVPYIFGFFIVVALVPYVVGLAKTPPGSVYLGSVHYPSDYVYYLAYIRQGEERVIIPDYLFTTEPMPNIILGWEYVILGRLGYILHLTPILSYQLGLVLGTLAYLMTSYYLLTLFFPKQWGIRVFAFLLFMFSTTLPRLVPINGVLELHPFYSWYNYGEPFIRLSSVPHHLFIQSSIFLILIATFLPTDSKRRLIRNALFGGIAGVILGFLQPVQWVLLTGCIGLYFCIEGLLLLVKKISFQEILKRLIPRAIPLCCFILIGTPCVIYLKSLFNQIPFTYTSIWEASQSPTMDLITFIRYHGSVFVIGALGIPFFLYKSNRIRLLVTWITVFSLCIFFLPLTKKIPLLTFRYLSALPVLLYAGSAAYAIFFLSAFAKKFTPIVRSVIFSILFFLLVPLFFVQLNQKIQVDPTNPLFYLSQDIYDTFLTARKISTSSDSFLIYWPYQTVFPAVAGRKEYFGQGYFQTIDFDKKSQNAYNFLINNMTDQEKKEFLAKSGLTYVIANRSAFSPPSSYLTPVYTGKELVIYKIASGIH